RDAQSTDVSPGRVELAKLLPAVQVKDVDLVLHVIDVGDRHRGVGAAAVRGNRHQPYLARVGEGVQHLAGVHVPDLDGIPLAACHRPLAVGGEGDAQPPVGRLKHSYLAAG